MHYAVWSLLSEYLVGLEDLELLELLQQPLHCFLALVHLGGDWHIIIFRIFFLQKYKTKYFKEGRVLEHGVVLAKRNS